MKIINLCPHPVVLYDNDSIITFSPSGIIARCEELTSPVYHLDGLPMIIRGYGKIADLPDPQERTLYIVSMLIRTQLPERNDIISPGDPVRDQEGRIIGCKNFVINKV